MSTYGFPDGQEITQWLGQVLAEQQNLAIGAGSTVLGPFSLANFASIVVAIKPTGGSVTVRVRQAIANGPATLILEEDLVVTAGETVFQAFVLFGDQVTVELDGGGVGTTVDYAVYPSNTTTNAQVIQSATINVQHNGALVGTEQGIDFEDALGFAWTVTDDGPNQRVKITPPSLPIVPIQTIVVPGGGAAAVDFTSIPQTFEHLLLIGAARNDEAVTFDGLGNRFNGDSAANYDWFFNGSSGTNQTAAVAGYLTGANATAGQAAPLILLVENYAAANNRKHVTAISSLWALDANTSVIAGGVSLGNWHSNAAINRWTLLSVGHNLVQPSVFTLYGVSS